MKNTESKNEIVKRQFFHHLTHAKGFCPSTISDIEKAILHFQTFSNNVDFGKFSQKMAVNFKQWLRDKKNNDSPLAISTQHTYLRHTEKFFAWLSQQPGYKSKFSLTDTEYLHMTKKDRRVAAQSTPRQFPSLEHILKLADSIQITSEIDRRDRAVIALTAMTGIRDDALASLPFANFNEQTRTIYQNPRTGVETKFSKNMATVILIFHDNLMNYFLDWVHALRAKNWDAKAPLFPSSKREHGEESILFTLSTSVIPEFWKGADRIRDIFKKRAETAGVPYFPPHCFKHFAIVRALAYCKTGEEIKAVSQNFGHENVATTLRSYGNFQPDQLSNILCKMNFSGEPRKSSDEKMDEVLQLIQQMKTKLTP